MAIHRHFSSNQKVFGNSFFILKSFIFLIFFNSFYTSAQQNQNTILDSSSSYFVNTNTLGRTPIGGDTIFIASERVKPLKFESLVGSPGNPIVIINKDGQVKIDGISENAWGALTFENCKYIKVSGKGHPGFKYGFELSAVTSGLSFSEFSSDCEAENIKISHNGFFGIHAIKIYNGNPPNPLPVFENLTIHDCFIENVSEGMYIGETTTPGLEFKNVRIYNNIVRNTLRESIQIANASENVEIYNNTLINAGLEGESFHMNNLQIGDNTVASIFNNIIIGAPDYGIINFGKGDVFMNNNYIENSKGVFMDNRTVSDTLLLMEVSNNYFKSLVGDEVLRNMNEMNDLIASNNIYDTNILFYKDLNGVDNEILSNNNLSQVSGVLFTDPASNDYSLAPGIADEYLGMGAPGGPEFLPFDDPATTPRQLVVTPDMVTDNVIGGSIDSPLFLFDEQDIDVDADQHPVSMSWRPFYHMDSDSYHTTVDLGDEHFISQINLHDMNSTFDFTVEYYDGFNWVTLFTDPCDNYNEWVRVDTNASSRYLRFSMYDSPYAAVNEIIIYGYPLVKDSQQIIINSSMVTDMVDGGSVDSPDYLFDEQDLDLFSNQTALSLPWKPFYDNTKAPYNAVVQLNQEYKLSKIALHDMQGTNDMIVETSRDGENWTTLFVDTLEGFNVWQINEVNVITKYLRFTMLDSPYALVNEILVFGYPLMTLPGLDNSLENQIVVTPNMVSDMVPGGSVDTPLYLFDEQETVNPILDEHPTSNNWRPFYTNANAPYYTTVDLGLEYHITKIYIHDMHSTHNFNIEFDDNSGWSHLLPESCDGYNVWKVHDVNVTTSKLRLSMLDSPYAGVNEIILIGYPVGNVGNKSTQFTDKTPEQIVLNENLKPILFPNPVKDQINLKLSDASEIGHQNVRIFDITGNLIYDMNIKENNFDAVIQIDASQFISNSGLYLLVYENDKGTQETIKFYKS
jgi:hypothetical protein